MTTIVTNELEQRLKQLESEQESQKFVLNDLGDFEKDIRKLEATLAEINNYTIEQVEDDFERDELEETKKLERELQRMSKEDILPPVRKPQTQTVNKKNESTGSLKPSTDDKTAKQPQKISPNSATQSYVICLMFNPKSPQEWSGNGWCEYGKGMRYTNPEQAKQIFRKLKKQWPSYPLKIFKR